MTNPIEPERMTSLDREDLARRYVTSAELWLRRLVHHQLSRAIGPSYVTAGPWKNQLRDRIAQVIQGDPGKYQREIDATTFEQLIDIICHPAHFSSDFADPLLDAYPLGSREARFFLNHLKGIRNDVQHGRGCSARQLERAICYSNDLADSLKAHFRKVNMGREYDVPLIVRYTDNRGNSSTLEGVSLDMSTRIIDWRRGPHGDLYTGDNLVAEVEVDPSFAAAEYDVFWYWFGGPRMTGARVELLIENRHVGEQFELRFEVITKRDWHRSHGRDDSLCLLFRVRPPITR